MRKVLQRRTSCKDTKTQHAVIHNIVVLGEAAIKVQKAHAAFVERHPHFPLQSMRGMRNRLVHGYHINLDLVWDTIKDVLPEFLKLLPAARRAALDEP